MERLGRFSASAQRAASSRVCILLLGYAAAAFVVATNGFAWAAHCHEIDHLLIAVLSSYAIAHVLAMGISAAHLLGFVHKYSLRQYYKFVYGPAAKKQRGNAILTLVYMVVGGPGFTALALLGPLIDMSEPESAGGPRRPDAEAVATSKKASNAPPVPVADPEAGDSDDDE